MAASFLQILSAIFGWVYTTLWSLSFYPQPIHNVRRGSIAGINIDFFVVNVLGFVAYFISTAVFLFSPVIRAQYAERHHGLTPTVQINDLAFAGHAVVLTIIALSQFWLPVWGFEKPKKDDRDLRPSWTILAIFFGSIAGVAIVTLVVALGPRDDVQNGWAWIDVIYSISFVKLFITLIKYTPQIITNYNNKSTKGWAIEGMLLDLFGGILSVAQLGIDSYLQRDWSGITGNPVKLALGNISIFFDLIFITQHYILYKDSDSKTEDAEADTEREDEPLLGGSR